MHNTLNRRMKSFILLYSAETMYSLLICVRVVVCFCVCEMRVEGERNYYSLASLRRFVISVRFARFDFILRMQVEVYVYYT